jgi:hypothetical protein
MSRKHERVFVQFWIYAAAYLQVITLDADTFQIGRKIKRGPKKDEKVMEIVSRPEFSEDNKSGLRSDRDQ